MPVCALKIGSCSSAATPIDDFYSLVDLLRNYKPGEIVDTVILRDDVVMHVPITLTGWD